MTDKKQPEALRLAGLLELAPEDGVEPQTTEDAAAELRRLHAENEALASKLKAHEDLDEAASDVQLLRMGYAAARLEIESLRAAQPAPQQEAQEPVAWRWVPSKVWSEFVYTEDPKRAQHARDNGIDVQPVFTTPQPTQPQAGAVPLTDEHIRAMAREHPAEDLCGWSYRLGVADTERHHGIKGGQHGAE